MKILIYSDTHIAQDSSIVKGTGEKYSKRLDNVIQSLNWAEELARKEDCSLIVNLGDTFDKPVILPMEATAVQDIHWADELTHKVLVGNHDSNVASLEYSSTMVLKKLPNFDIITQATEWVYPIMPDRCRILFLPYITEDVRKPLAEYLSPDWQGKTIIMSHNDIAGFDFGRFVSQEGFKIEDIETNCDLFLNGHLHNSSYLSDKILNVGNLTGQNFGEDGFKYKHGAWILETRDLSLKFVENPYALKFYKIDLTKRKFPGKLADVAYPAVVMLTVTPEQATEARTYLQSHPGIIESRLLVENNVVVDDNLPKIERVDYMAEFQKHIVEHLGNSQILQEELGEICK